MGLQDLMIIDDDDATLIVRRGQTEKVKNVIEQLVSTNNAAAIEHSFEYRPWGMFENLLESSACKVKRLTVDPKQNLSLQYHHKRSEHWVVVEGIATVQIDGKVLTLEAGEAVDIPLGAHHALGNDTEDPVVVIEIQMGAISAKMILSGSVTHMGGDRRGRRGVVVGVVATPFSNLSPVRSNGMGLCNLSPQHA